MKEKHREMLIYFAEKLSSMASKLGIALLGFGLGTSASIYSSFVTTMGMLPELELQEIPAGLIVDGVASMALRFFVIGTVVLAVVALVMTLKQFYFSQWMGGTPNERGNEK